VDEPYLNQVGIMGSLEKAASYGVVLDALIDHLGRRCLHEPGLFRVTRPTGDVRALWTALSAPPPQSTLAASSGAPLDLASAVAWHAACLRRLAEESDPVLVAAALLLHLRAHPPLLPGRAFQGLLAWGQRHAPMPAPNRRQKSLRRRRPEGVKSCGRRNDGGGSEELDSASTFEASSDENVDDDGGSGTVCDLSSEEAALAGARALLDQVGQRTGAAYLHLNTYSSLKPAH
jgi:hypothetical protein